MQKNNTHTHKKKHTQQQPPKNKQTKNDHVTYKVFVDLISDDGHLVSVGNTEDVLKVLLAVHGAAGVGRVVHHDGRRVIVDEFLQVFQVHFPGFLWLCR